MESALYGIYALVVFVSEVLSIYVSGDTANYKIYTNKTCTLTRLSKHQYYSKFFNNLTNIKKKRTWEGINNVLARKLNNTKRITFIKDTNDDNSVTNDPSTIANVVNDHFASFGPKLVNTSICKATLVGKMRRRKRHVRKLPLGLAL